MNIKVQRVLFAILILTIFASIFVFSSQDGDSSINTSKRFTRKIINTLHIGKNLNYREKEILIENLQHIIRKLAHFVIYTFAGFSMYGFINTFDIHLKNKIIVILSIGIIYAISDELHQMLSGGRTPAIKDVAIDSCGVLMGIFIALILIKMINKINYRYNTINNC